MKLNRKIKGIAFDIDGTLMQDGNALPTAIETLSKLRLLNYSIRFLTNTTGKSPEQISQTLNQIGICARPDEIQTSVTSCIHLLNSQENNQCFLALPQNTLSWAQKHFNMTNDNNEDFVVLGDLGENFSYSLMNTVFNKVMNGAKLICFHKNPFYISAQKNFLDSGAFTHGLEYATNTKAIITGKPSMYFYQQALDDMKLKPHQLLIVGDDVLTDIAGANNIRTHSLLVKTGKYKDSQLKTIKSNSIDTIDSLSRIFEYL